MPNDNTYLKTPLSSTYENDRSAVWQDQTQDRFKGSQARLTCPMYTYNMNSNKKQYTL